MSEHPRAPSPVPLVRFNAASDLAAAIAEWQSWLGSERRVSPHTLAAYGRDLAAFLDFLVGHLALVPDLAVLLDADVVTIAVEQLGPARPRLSHHGVQILDAGTVDAVLGAERDVALLDETVGDPKLFGSGAGLVRSAALLRLSVSAGAPAGLLCIGTRRAGKFHAGQGTELLGFLARALGITIAAWLDLPA